MSNENVPFIAARKPAMVELEAGKDYYWCRCGRSGNQPVCDGTHAQLGELDVGDPVPEPESELPTAKPIPEEPTVARIHELARDGLSKLGHHGEMGAMGAMGVLRKDLPHWDDIQILPTSRTPDVRRSGGEAPVGLFAVPIPAIAPTRDRFPTGRACNDGLPATTPRAH